MNDNYLEVPDNAKISVGKPRLRMFAIDEAMIKLNRIKGISKGQLVNNYIENYNNDGNCIWKIDRVVRISLEPITDFHFEAIVKYKT